MWTLKRFLTALVVASAALPAFLAPATGSVPSARAAGPCAAAATPLEGEEQAFLQLINDYRVRYGLDPLRVSSSLRRAASWMAADMTGHGYFGHVDSLGRRIAGRARDCGYPAPAGENIAAGDATATGEHAFNLFLGSGVHRENMLDPDYRVIGVARAGGPSSGTGWYWVTDFGTEDDPEGSTAAGVSPTAPDQARFPGIVSGWNLLAWPGAAAAPQAALEATGGLAIYRYDGAGGWEHFAPGLPPVANTLEVVLPGLTYWIVVP